MGTLAAVAVAGVGLRLLLAARAADGAVIPPAALVLGGVGAFAVGLAFTPFALADALPRGVGEGAFVLLLLMLAGTCTAWAMLRRTS